MQELVKDLTAAVHRTQGIEPSEIGSTQPYRDRNGIIHIPVIDLSNEWKLQDKLWVRL